jgi:uncharacterized protein (TIGR00725 family)
MKILITGSWQKSKAVAIAQEAYELGKLLAEGKHAILSGGGTGVSALVVASYKEHSGERYIAYFPSKAHMDAVGEECGPDCDERIDTDLDYPQRNIELVKACDGMIALHGGLGTLTEIIHAVKDYNKPVAVIEKGDLAHWIKGIHELKEKVFLTADPKEAVEHLSRTL